MESDKKYAGAIATTIAGICLIIVAGIAGSAYRSRNFQKTITVTGSSQQVISSDSAVWNGSFSRNVNADGLKTGNGQIKADATAVESFLKDHGIATNEIDMQPVFVSTNYSSVQNKDGNSSQVFSGYTLTQTFTVQSKNLDKVNSAVDSSGDLLDKGVIFQGGSTQYYYTKLSELKIQMINDATKDATARAQAIAQNAGAKVGSLRNATVGVIQITPENSSDLSSEGYYDTTSVKKEVTVVVHASYSVQ
jgi:hypothetical protein